LTGILTLIVARQEDVLAWRNRPLERVYPVVFLDALLIPA
jgi:transposase-like protein